jgi:hypothetical protein
MRLTDKQKKALDIAEYYSREVPVTEWNLSFIGLSGVVDDENGIDCIQAFFDRSERGIIHNKVNGLSRLLSLLYGHRRVALCIAMYKEDWARWMLFPTDFTDAPWAVQELVKREVFGKIRWDNWMKEVPEVSDNLSVSCHASVEKGEIQCPIK